MSKPLRAPFDSLVLAAILAEVRGCLGGKAQRVLELDPTTIAIALYSGGRERWLLFSCDAKFARMHFISDRPRKTPPAGTFVKLIRANLDGARLIGVEQVGFDRIAILHFEREGANFKLIAEIMGKHSNVILVGPDGRIVACAKTVGTTKSSRPVVVGRTYTPPPFEPRRPVQEARSLEVAKQAEGASPFLMRLLEAVSEGSDARFAEATRELQKRVESGAFEPIELDGIGAYPVSIAALAPGETRISSMSEGVEKWLSTESDVATIDHAKKTLFGRLERLIVSREATIHDLNEALNTAKKAGSMQMKGELILAYQSQIQEGDRILNVPDYEGNNLSIPLNPELSAAENANRWFEKAKKAKSGAPEVRDQLARFERERADLVELLSKVEAAESLAELEECAETARERHWLHSQRVIEIGKPEKVHKDPFDGYKIKTLLGPGGLTVLYGENATANDYLTLRVAKANDYWLHVRGHTSAHVVVQTHNHPEKVGAEALRFAAEVAVRNSTLKHSGYVPVDVTLKKYVRKPKGAPVGTALYTHEKTIHVELER